MSFEEDFKLIKTLTEIQSCTGNEGEVRRFISELVEPYCDKMETDYLGNLFCYINGEKEPQDGEPKLKVMLDAHMDEIGMIVRYIDKNGFIRFSQVGGQNPRILPGQSISILSEEGEEILGIIGEKPIHLIKQDERKKTAKMEDLFIDIGASSKEDAEKHVNVGDYITFKQECRHFKDTERIFSKALDDRAGCFILIKLLMTFSEIKQELDKDFIFLFAAQEEIGVRGATVGSYKVHPDIGIAVEVTHAIDYPGVSEDKFHKCSLGDGIAIATGPNVFPKFVKLMIEIAREKDIKYALTAVPRAASNDGRAIQLTKTGIPTSIVAMPLRYMHTNIETMDYKDILATFELLKAFLLMDLRSAIKL